jgi:hypothetical protein
MPIASGYNVVVGYRVTPGSGTFTVFGTSLGTFDLSGLSAINVTAPIGSASYVAGTPLPITWTSSSVVTTGEFGVWATSSSGWVFFQSVAPNPADANYSIVPPLNLPPASGPWNIVIGYRPTAGSGTWTTWGTSTGTFTIL